MAKILVAFDTVDEGFERLKEAHEVIRPPKGTDFSQDELQRLIVDCDILCSVFDIHIGKKLMQRGNRLRLVANYAVGYNNIDIAAARQLGIAVTNTPLSVIEPTAELAMALMLSCSRRTTELDRALRSSNGKLRLGRLGMMGMDLYGQTLGIVGYGNIGAAVARRAKAFGMKVLYYKRTRLSQHEEAERDITYATLTDLLKASDVISLHTPYSPQTHHQIDARALALMKPSALLINTARGSIVDEDALIAALSSGSIAGAGLDVFEDSDVPRSALLDLPNVVLTPHVGTQTYEARSRMVHELVDNVLGFLAGSPNINRVDLL